MCPPIIGSTRKPSFEEGEASGGRLRHWDRAALELRRVRRGAAWIPLRGNPGRVSTSKVPGRNTQEPGSAVFPPGSACGEKRIRAYSAVSVLGFRLDLLKVMVVYGACRIDPWVYLVGPILGSYLGIWDVVRNLRVDKVYGVVFCGF
ncbi:hypothetical protein NDU88_002171 [Pleurodeles waltl]|uniref:Uncharacterized protein n=1 Tax=Pleurodeles waltl TaxID=8319 RepID=A0AAV7UCE0_PLEWA|nr:hypothetical protein NDU88_002171 [Pleurodeles waltl]